MYFNKQAKSKTIVSRLYESDQVFEELVGVQVSQERNSRQQHL